MSPVVLLLRTQRMWLLRKKLICVDHRWPLIIDGSSFTLRPAGTVRAIALPGLLALFFIWINGANTGLV